MVLKLPRLRKMRFCDMITEPHGYEPTGPNADILGVIMQKYMHKADNPQNPNAKARTTQARGGRKNSAGDNNGMAG